VVAQVPAPAPAIEPLPLEPSEHLVRSQPAPGPDAIDVLLTQVEARYQAGMDDYRQGNLEKAKEEFDQAVSLLLESNLDVQGDDRLSAEFNHLVEDVSGAEAAALERGDTLSPHNYVPAPIESFSGLTFPVDPKVKQQAQEELKSVRSDIPLASNEYVVGVLTYLQHRGRGYVETVLKRIGLYKPLISETLSKEGLPQDLIYLAAGESAFNPFAVSRKWCVGIWQFSLGTGQLYGLKKDRWVDERSDPTKSTQAAARHLKDLYQQFGDWFLAMAAYDSGPVTVQKAIEKTGYADFWKLRELHALPRETENYVPVFLATEMIAKEPKAYGFDVQPESPEPTDQVTPGMPTDLRLVAQLIDRPVEELIKLNPSLLRWTTPANDPGYVLSLPAGTKDLFDQNITSIPPDKRVWWRAYKVEGGETLASVAKKFRISPAALAQANQIRRDASLETGSHLVVPLAAGKESSLARVRERAPRRLIYYHVRPGDTLELIADRYDVTPYQIRRWNNMKTSALVSGKALRLYVVGGGRGARRTSSKRRAGSPATHPAKKMAQLAQPSSAKSKPNPVSNPTSPRQEAIR
jgi:membrane-bound lytic murein transglycosylase D